MTEQAASHPLPFAGRSGKGIRIAIIDSGVHPEHPHIDASHIDAGVAVQSDGRIFSDADAVLDRLGHGTAVTAAIQEKAPAARCLPVRVFKDSLKTSAAALVAAIRWAIAQRVDLINLSLGSTNAAHAPIFERVAQEAMDAGVVLLAAREAGDSLCYPGILDQVIGVSLDWDCPRDRYCATPENEGWRLYASGYPRPIPGVPQRRNLYGISFAVAQMTGFAALALESRAGANRDERLKLVRQALFVKADRPAFFKHPPV